MKEFKEWLARFISRLTAIFVGRRIKDVSTWDGSASNYPDTASYCKACLIDANAAAGKTGEDITQALCKLPVREAGDSADTYVKQAIYAAAGGHGITQVTKPDGVSDDDWNALVKKAAKEIIAAYKEMEEVAPDAVYKLAGMEAPERQSRAVTLNAAVWAALEEMPDAWVLDVYVNQNGIMLLLNIEGKLYSMPIAVGEDDTVTAGEMVEINVDPGANNRMQIIRQTDGKHRWFARAASAVINKAGAIDSRALFDDFIKRWQDGQKFTLRYYHDPRTDFGDGDWLARSDNLLLASGTLREDHPLAKAVIAAAEDGTLDWPGTSIGFYADGEIERIKLDQGLGELEVPVYTRGWLEEISFLDEQDACSYMTRFVTEVEVRRTTIMDERAKAALYKLFGDDNKEAADAFIDSVDKTNDQIKDERLLTRENDTTEQTVEPTTEQPAESPAETASVVPALDLAPAFAEIRQEISQAISNFDTLVQGVKQELAELKSRMDALAKTDDEKHQQWLDDLPAPKTPVSYRPRDVSRTTQPGKAVVNSDVIANQTLESLPRSRNSN